MLLLKRMPPIAVYKPLRGEGKDGDDESVPLTICGIEDFVVWRGKLNGALFADFFASKHFSAET